MPVGGIAIVAAVLSVTSFWYGGVAFITCLMWARFGVVHVPALVIGAMELWAGGLFGLAAGTLVRTPPALPDRSLIIGWTVVIFAGVLAVMVLRRPEVEELLPERTRRIMDGRYIALGALGAAVVLFAAGYL
jgi:hypothetical protein